VYDFFRVRVHSVGDAFFFRVFDDLAWYARWILFKLVYHVPRDVFRILPDRGKDIRDVFRVHTYISDFVLEMYFNFVSLVGMSLLYSFLT